MNGDIISEIPHSFSNPRRFLLEDECIEDYRERLVGLVMDLKPRGALEFRQVELILLADVDIDRQYRIIRQRLDVDEAGPSEAARIIHNWTAFEASQDEDFEPPEERVRVSKFGDPSQTPAIAKAYTRNREMLSLHQRELAACERRRRQAVELLYKMQDRRAARNVPDAEVAWQE